MGRNETYIDYFYGFYLSLEIIPRAIGAVMKIAFNWCCRKIYAIACEFKNYLFPGLEVALD